MFDSKTKNNRQRWKRTFHNQIMGEYKVIYKNLRCVNCNTDEQFNVVLFNPDEKEIEDIRDYPDGVNRPTREEIEQLDVYKPRFGTYALGVIRSECFHRKQLVLPGDYIFYSSFGVVAIPEKRFNKNYSVILSEKEDKDCKITITERHSETCPKVTENIKEKCFEKYGYKVTVFNPYALATGYNYPKGTRALTSTEKCNYSGAYDRNTLGILVPNNAKSSKDSKMIYPGDYVFYVDQENCYVSCDSCYFETFFKDENTPDSKKEKILIKDVVIFNPNVAKTNISYPQWVRKPLNVEVITISHGDHEFPTNSIGIIDAQFLLNPIKNKIHMVLPGDYLVYRKNHVDVYDKESFIERFEILPSEDEKVVIGKKEYDSSLFKDDGKDADGRKLKEKISSRNVAIFNKKELTSNIFYPQYVRSLTRKEAYAYFNSNGLEGSIDSIGAIDSKYLLNPGNTEFTVVIPGNYIVYKPEGICIYSKDYFNSNFEIDYVPEPVKEEVSSENPESKNSKMSPPGKYVTEKNEERRKALIKKENEKRYTWFKSAMRRTNRKITYKLFQRYLHNELEVTPESILNLVKETIEKTVMAKMKDTIIQHKVDYETFDNTVKDLKQLQDAVKALTVYVKNLENRIA